MSISNLDRPNFIDRDPNAITEAIKTEWERLTGKTLYPAQADRLFIDLMAYRETLVRNSIQEAAEQNLLAFARAPVLDYLGDLMRVYRLAGAAASTTLTFTLDTVRQSDTLIPKGTQVANQASQGVVFVTDENINITAGQLTGSVMSSAQVAGASANELNENSLTYIVDSLGLSGLSVSNGEISGGADAETDDQLRERIRLAPEAYSTAGCRLAYRFHALGANPTIIDVAPTREEGGIINIYVLTKTGSASRAVLNDVIQACNAEKVRPLSDEVNAFTAKNKNYTLSIEATMYETADIASIKDYLSQKADQYTNAKRQKLGQDIDPSQVIDALFIDGVHSLKVFPSETLVIESSEWANCTDINFSYQTVSSA